MATSRAEFARAALDGMRDAQMPYALLHGRDLVEGSEGFSDVDVVVGLPPAVVVAKSAASWAAVGLVPILLWPYSAGGSVSVFLSNRDASGGVQLDMLYDVSGRGAYGVRSGELLARVVVDGRYPEVDELGALVYLWQKRLVKWEIGRLPAIVDRARELPRGALEVAAERITGSDRLVRVAHEGTPIRKERSRRQLADLVRLMRRLNQPIGVWIHARDAAVGEVLTGRLSAILVLVRSGPVPAGAVPWWYVRRVAPVLLRPGAYVSWGGRPDWGTLHPDAAVDGDVGQAAEAMVSAMSARVLRCVS